ncbi:alpha/beta fold hydrolase [Pontibacter fetidus]|uniref:Alpha/beta hydrolase n=1 Tax=Pontibacter fetidus TaxID=2700082 RepID=A0A6B2H5E4_9BACT|nr:alpha/beta hydrolase [Pontibacter fetidus]NDK55010.1 alpha/beta hydrolase [Pontibacter fetidus]
MSTVYFISGLGADERMFHNLKLKCKHIAYVHWIEPETDESLHEYAKRLLPQIHHPNPILVGMSFGGVVAIELAKIIDPKLTILISSMASSRSLPWYYNFMGWLRLHKIVPVPLMKRFHFLAPMLFGAATYEEKATLKQVILETDPHFLRWALGQLLTWHQPDHYEHVTMIHGTADRILPIRYHHNIIRIKNAGHLMVLSHAKEISAILDDLIGDCTP